ncbi:hypothetical protein MTO96_028244 [Rhipicephalus appendiculatus]
MGESEISESHQSDVSSASAIEPVTPAPEPGPVRPTQLFICTVGAMVALPLMVPEDGLCSIIFYTDVFFNSQKKNIEPVYSDTGFNVLKSLLKNYTETSFGLSMFPGTVGQFIASKKSEILKELNDLFADGWVHFGMLNVDDIQDYDVLKKGSLKYLELAQESLESQKSTLPEHHVALGVGQRHSGDGDKLLSNADLALKDFPAISIIVLKVHLESSADQSVIYPLPPNPDQLDLKSKNLISLASLGTNVKDRLTDMTSNNKTYALLSFALFGRGYRMNTSWTDPASRPNAVHGINTDYRTACNDTSSSDTTDSMSTYHANVTTKFLAIFDTVDNIRTKIDHRKASSLPTHNSGIMAYRVEMDDWANNCGDGVFARLNALKSNLLS